MNTLDLARVYEFVNENIDSFHEDRIRTIQNLKLKQILKRKNPYLFKAKNINSAPELVSSVMEAFLSSSEEGLFGGFLEALAIFVNEMTCSGQKSSAPGIDLEFNRENIRYIVAIKSGTNWGNSSQQRALRENFRTAIKILRQSRQVPHVQAVLGMCYGKSKDVDTGEYLKICGQSFWTFISGEPNLYIDMVEPLGYEAQKRNEFFLQEKSSTYNRLVGEFITEFCYESGQINWPKLVSFNSGNMK
jgi:Type II restriction endonuclease EcoO109I